MNQKEMKMIKQQFKKGDFVFSENKDIEMYDDDGEAIMRIVRTCDGDIHFMIDGVRCGRARDSVRHRTSGSLIMDMQKRLEITRTLNYLMCLLDDAYPKGTQQEQRKLLNDRQEGNW